MILTNTFFSLDNLLNRNENEWVPGLCISKTDHTQYTSCINACQWHSDLEQLQIINLFMAECRSRTRMKLNSPQQNQRPLFHFSVPSRKRWKVHFNLKIRKMKAVLLVFIGFIATSVAHGTMYSGVFNFLRNFHHSEWLFKSRKHQSFVWQAEIKIDRSLGKCGIFIVKT